MPKQSNALSIVKGRLPSSPGMPALLGVVFGMSGTIPGSRLLSGQPANPELLGLLAVSPVLHLKFIRFTNSRVYICQKAM